MNRDLGEADPRLYIRVAAWLLRQIGEGTLKPGDPVPAIGDLAAQHKLSRASCGKGMRMLEADGVLIRVPGLGYYVAARPARPAATPRRP